MNPKILLSVNKGKDWYVRAVEACGGVPTAQYLPEISVDYDGLILGGGNDIHPKRYAQAVAGSVDFDEARDERETALIDAFVRAGKPIFGICRGGQLLNVFFGGTLCQHLPCVDEHKSDAEEWLSHAVVAEKESVFARIYGEKFRVNSFHHQAADELGKGLRATLRAEGNGVVEGLEHESLPIIGLQWHPEKMCLAARREDTVDGLKIIRYFVNLCK